MRAVTADPSTELAVGDVLDLKILKVDKAAGRISLGLKQMSADPWEEAVATRHRRFVKVYGSSSRKAHLEASWHS